METGMKIGVTGAAGFIGGHVLSAVLNAGMRPVAVVRPGTDRARLSVPEAEIRSADLLDEGALARAFEGLEGVIHLAALTRARNESEFLRANADGVARAARAFESVRPDGTFVYVSSLAAAGPSSAEAAVDEEARERPVTPYGRSKLAGETALRETVRTLDWCIVRPPIVYGPGERDMLEMFRMATRGVVPVTGPTGARYSIVHAEDLARGILAAFSRRSRTSRVFNIAEPTAYTWPEIAARIGRAVGRDPWCPRIPTPLAWVIAAGGSLVKPFMARPPLVTLDKIPEIVAPGWVCAVDRARRELGFETTITLDEGARGTAAWYRERGWIR